MAKNAAFPDYKTKNTSDLIPYARNSRTHSDEQIGKIAASIKEFGFLNPVIIDGDNGIIAGHGRVMAAQRLGIHTVPVIQVGHLNDEQKRAYVIADNKLPELGGWNDELLRIEIQEIGEIGFDIDLLGFDKKEISKLFDSTAGITIGDSLQEKDLSEIIVKFQSCDKIEIMNAINLAISEFKDAHVWLESGE